MNLLLQASLDQLKNPFNNTLIYKDGNCVFFNTNLLENSDTEALVNMTILLLIQNLDNSYNKVLIIHSEVFNSFQGRYYHRN